jgi:hypothetical protein
MNLLNVLRIPDPPSGSSKSKRTRKRTLGEISLNALLVSGISLFAIMPEHFPNLNELWVMFRAFGAAFVVQLATELGVKKG